jgi:hypothetical protein
VLRGRQHLRSGAERALEEGRVGRGELDEA